MRITDGRLQFGKNASPTFHEQTEKIGIYINWLGYLSYTHYDYFPKPDLNSNEYLVKKHNCGLVKM